MKQVKIKGKWDERKNGKRKKMGELGVNGRKKKGKTKEEKER